METVAYLELTQEYENSEQQEASRPSYGKSVFRVVATALTVAGTAWAGGLFSAAPALAYGWGCCRPRPVVCCRPRPVSCCRPRPVCQIYCATPYSSGFGDGYYGTY